MKWNLKEKAPLAGLFVFAIASLSFLPTSGVDRITAAIIPHKQVLKQKFRNWGLVNSKAKSHIHAIDAWKIEQGDRKITVAVIDTGIDPFHPDLRPNIWKDRDPSRMVLPPGHIRVPGSKTAKLTRRERVLLKRKKNFDGVFGWDFVSNRPNPVDNHGHGTHVAGIIGAIANPSEGISGVAPVVSIMGVRYYSDSNPGSVNLGNTVKAINYAVQKGAKIINYSGGGPEFSESEYLAIRNAEAKGVLFIAAAGNEKKNSDLSENYYYPSAYGLSNIISVAATNIENKLLKSSNWGLKKVHIAAPGESIYSTLPNGGYGYMSGTSQATAFVSGLAALLLAKDPSLTPVQIKNIILNSVDPIPSLHGKVSTGGRVNAYAALLALVNKNNPEKIKKQKIHQETIPNLVVWNPNHYVPGFLF